MPLSHYKKLFRSPRADFLLTSPKETGKKAATTMRRQTKDRAIKLAGAFGLALITGAVDYDSATKPSEALLEGASYNAAFFTKTLGKKTDNDTLKKQFDFTRNLFNSFESEVSLERSLANFILDVGTLTYDLTAKTPAQALRDMGYDRSRITNMPVNLGSAPIDYGFTR